MSVKRTVLSALAAVVVAAVALSVNSASATVIRIDNGNTWTVGKGDVQSLFGWNAKTTDQQFGNVSFRYQRTRHSDVVCDYTISYDEVYTVEEIIGGVKNRRTVIRTKTANHTMNGSFDDQSLQLMERTLQFEMRKNTQGNVVGATIWPGGSSTTVDLATACDSSKVDLGAMVFATEFGGTIENLQIQGTVHATEVSRTITETIFATAPVMTPTRSGAMVATGGTTTGTLWTSQDKWVQTPPTTVAPETTVVVAP